MFYIIKIRKTFVIYLGLYIIGSVSTNYVLNVTKTSYCLLLCRVYANDVVMSQMEQGKLHCTPLPPVGRERYLPQTQYRIVMFTVQNKSSSLFIDVYLDCENDITVVKYCSEMVDTARHLPMAL